MIEFLVTYIYRNGWRETHRVWAKDVDDAIDTAQPDSPSATIVEIKVRPA